LTFKRVNDFSTENPTMLDRELSQLEDNVDSETRAIRATYLLAPAIQSFVANPSAAANIVAFKVPGQLSVDPSKAIVTVVFPPLSPANFGQVFSLIRRSTGFATVTANQVSTVACNLSTTWPTFSTAANLVTQFFCDASGYYFQ
jgi:hypothetical protein